MLFERRAASVVAEPNAYGERVRVREKSTTGEIITPESALSVPAVLAAFTILSEDISSLPLILYLRKTGGDKERAWSSPYYKLMHDTPNPEHTSMVFREIMMAHLLAWGNFYGQIIIDTAGTVTEIWPLRPDRMTVERKNGARIYHYITSAGKERTFYQDEMLHIPSFGFDGLVGYSRIALARNAIGLALATEEYGSKFFANDARPGVVLKHPNKLSQPAYDRPGGRGMKSIRARKRVMARPSWKRGWTS
jgi:HK97 family phage portal protein